MTRRKASKQSLFHKKTPFNRLFCNKKNVCI